MTKKERRGHYRRNKDGVTTKVKNPNKGEKTHELDGLNIDQSIELLESKSLEEAIEIAKDDDRAGIKKYINKRTEEVAGGEDEDEDVESTEEDSE